jgi:hypothetical protein
MATVQPPPTYTLPIEVDEKTKKVTFSPIWLRWFVDLAAILSTSTTTPPSGITGENPNITMAVEAFRPRVPPTQLFSPDSQQILAATVFSPLRAPTGLFRADSQSIIAAQVFGG